MLKGNVHRAASAASWPCVRVICADLRSAESAWVLAQLSADAAMPPVGLEDVRKLVRQYHARRQSAILLM